MNTRVRHRRWLRVGLVLLSLIPLQDALPDSGRSDADSQRTRQQRKERQAEIQGWTDQDWESFGKALTESPEYKQLSPKQQAVYVADRVGAKLDEGGIVPNVSVWGRARSGIEHGKLDSGTCSDLTEKLGAAFTGAGIDNGKVVVNQTGLRSWNLLNVNSDHGAPFVVIDGEKYVMDLWLHGGDQRGWFSSGKFSGFEGSGFDGVAVEDWKAIMEDSGYDLSTVEEYYVDPGIERARQEARQRSEDAVKKLGEDPTDKSLAQLNEIIKNKGQELGLDPDGNKNISELIEEISKLPESSGDEDKPELKPETSMGEKTEPEVQTGEESAPVTPSEPEQTDPDDQTKSADPSGDLKPDGDPTSGDTEDPTPSDDPELPGDVSEDAPEADPSDPSDDNGADPADDSSDDPAGQPSGGKAAGPASGNEADGTKDEQTPAETGSGMDDPDTWGTGTPNDPYRDFKDPDSLPAGIYGTGTKDDPYRDYQNRPKNWRDMSPKEQDDFMRGAEASPDRDQSTIPTDDPWSTGGALDQFADARQSDRQQRTSSAATTMGLSAQMGEASRAGDQQSYEAQRIRSAGGRDAQDIKDEAARRSAQKQREDSWGNVLGNAMADGIQQGAEAFGSTLGSAAADEVSGRIFGTRKEADTSSSGDADGSGDGAMQTASAPASGGGASDGGRKRDKSGGRSTDSDGDEDSAEGDGEADPSAADDPLGVRDTVSNEDGTVTITYGCRYTWTGKPPGPSRCPICSRETVSTESNTPTPTPDPTPVTPDPPAVTPPTGPSTPPANPPSPPSPAPGTRRVSGYF